MCGILGPMGLLSGTAFRFGKRREYPMWSFRIKPLSKEERWIIFNEKFPTLGRLVGNILIPGVKGEKK